MARKRRGRGEGSISKRSDDIWEAKVSLGYHATGKRRRVTVYGKSKAEVQQKLLDLQSKAVSGTLPDVGQMTVGQFLSRWLEVKKPTVANHTYLPYERYCRLHLVPHLGAVRLGKLTGFHVEQLYAALERGGVSASERRKAGVVLNLALRHAVRVKLIPFNPGADVPKPRAPKKEMAVLTPEQVGTFLEAAVGDRLFAMYVLAIDTGLRQGELFGLTWADIDFNAGFVTVRRSLEEVKGKTALKEVKTAKSRRRIDLATATVEALNEHRRRMLAEGNYRADAAVFCDTQGKWLRKSNVVRRSFKPLLAKAGLPPIRFYDLRHTAATLLLLENFNPKVVSERLGHSTIQLTLDTYSHVLPSMGKDAARAMDKFLKIGRS